MLPAGGPENRARGDFCRDLRSRPKVLGTPGSRALPLPSGPRLDLPPVPQPTPAVAADRSGEAALVGELMGPLLAHAEQGGDLHESHRRGHQFYVLHPMPSPSPSKPWGSGGSTLKFWYGMSPQSRSGGGGGMHTVGYAGSHFPLPPPPPPPETTPASGS